MVMTTWDGHLRIDHLAEADTVTLALVTVEPVTGAQLRAGLVAEFVTADSHGPPAFLAVAARDGRLPADVTELLGDRVSAAVVDLLAEGRPGRWLQLDLLELDDLAAAWAPYRVVVLAADRMIPENSGALGSWADELWTCLGLPRWRELLGPLVRPSLTTGFRGAEPSASDTDGGLRGSWRLPDELAVAVGVEPEVTWVLSTVEPDEVTVDLRVRTTGQPSEAVLQAGIDDGSQAWVSFEADGSGLRARLVTTEDQVSVRFRSEHGSAE